MTCRHAANDPECSSHPRYKAYQQEAEALMARYANPSKVADHVIEDVARVGPHLVLKVTYPSCPDCSYEGTKVMVFLDISELQALKWRTIDPHFREVKPGANEAPSPSARFPATPEGWEDALAYAQGKKVI